MKSVHEYDQFRSQVTPVLISKLEEFYLLGYKTINEAGLWNYLIKKKWRRTQPDIKLYEIVQEIMKVKISDYINFATIEAFKMSEMSIITEAEIQELLRD